MEMHTRVCGRIEGDRRTLPLFLLLVILLLLGTIAIP